MKNASSSVNYTNYVKDMEKKKNELFVWIRSDLWILIMKQKKNTYSVYTISYRGILTPWYSFAGQAPLSIMYV